MKRYLSVVYLSNLLTPSPYVGVGSMSRSWGGLDVKQLGWARCHAAGVGSMSSSWGGLDVKQLHGQPRNPFMTLRVLGGRKTSANILN